MRGKTKRILAVMLVVMMLLIVVAGCGGATTTEDNTKSPQSGKPSTFIADRQINGRIFLGGDGSQLPSDQINNEVAQKIKELTGITLKWDSTGADDSTQELTLALASGDLPEVMVNYLDHSGRPEMPVLLKAAQEGLFTDLKPYLANTQVYKKYLDPNFLPMDTRNNIMFRSDLNGKCYFVHMQIPREDMKEEDKLNGRGGMYIKEDIVKALNLDTLSIKTQEDFYNLLVKIKNGNFKDKNGKPVIPLGARMTGADLVGFVVRNYDFGNGTQFDIDTDGKVKHVAETDYVLKQIEFIQKLLKEKLMDLEFYTMDATRATENVVNGTFAITGYANENRSQFKEISYLPFYLNNYKGEENTYYVKAKEGYCTWEIPKSTKNPEEIVKFADFLATKQGKALWNYGTEGKTYEIKDGKYIYTPEFLNLKKESPDKVKDVVPQFWGWTLGNTDRNMNQDFGEKIIGSNSEPEEYAWKFKILNYNTPKFVYWDGYSAASFLSELPDLQPVLQPVLDNYKDTLIKAFFAKSFDEAKAIINSYRKALKDAGIEKYEQYLEEKNKKDPGNVVFYMHATY